MSSQPARGLALVLILLLAALPSARAEDPACETTIEAQDAAGQPHLACRDPDLIPTSQSAKATDERFPASMCGYVLNIAQDSQTKTFFYVQLSVDGFDEGSLQVRSFLNTGQETTALCWNATLPAGWHRFHLNVDPPRSDAPSGDVVEARENNNVGRDTYFFVRPTPQPNLQLTAFRVSPQTGRPGTDQFMVATVTNQGDAPSQPTLVEFADDNGVVARQPVPSIAGGKSAQVIQYNLTDTRPAGNFTALAVLDPDNATLLHCDNVRYVLCKPYTILPHPAPDLVLTNVTVHGSFMADRGLLVDALLKNIGDRSAALAQLRAYDGERPIANASRANLPAGQTIHFQFYIVLGAGEHVLRVRADPDNTTVEREEGNNEWDVPISIEGTQTFDNSTPNLLMERLDALPDDPKPGETVMVTALVRNVGDNTSNKTSVVFFADDLLLASREVPAIPPRASFTAVFAWDGGELGAHTLLARVDPDRLVNESTRDDNELKLDFAIVAPPETTPPDDITPTPPTTPSETPDTTPAAPPPEPSVNLTVTNFDIVTRDDSGKTKAYLGVIVRNPNLVPVGRVSVEFYLDGNLVGDKLIPLVGGAGTAAQRTDEIEVAPGPHTISADLRILGADLPPMHVEKAYTAPEKKTPSLGMLAFLAALGAVASAARRRGR